MIEAYSQRGGLLRSAVMRHDDDLIFFNQRPGIRFVRYNSCVAIDLRYDCGTIETYAHISQEPIQTHRVQYLWEKALANKTHHNFKLFGVSFDLVAKTYDKELQFSGGV